MIQKKKKSTFFNLAVAIVLLLVFLMLSFSNQKVKNLFFSLTEAPKSAILNVGDFFSSGFKIVFSLKDIIKENSELKEKNRDLIQKTIKLEDIKKENDLLRSQLSLKDRSEFNLLETKIISFDPNNLSDFVTINRGEADGVRKDMPVILPGNILLGKVFDVYPNYAKVMLITDNNNKVNVKSFFQKEEDRKNYSGVLNGYFGKSLFMDFIEKRTLVFQGDMIVTSGLDGTYPANLIVGYVDIIEDKDDAVFKQAYLTPSFLPISSNLAFVILDY